MTFQKGGKANNPAPLEPITDEQRDKIIRMWFSKFDYNSVPHIANAVGISERRIREFAKEHDLPKRRIPFRGRV